MAIARANAEKADVEDVVRFEVADAAAFRRDAERKMRSILAVRAIAEAEQITVSNAEVDAEYARLAKLHDTPEPEIRKVLSRDAVASAVTTQKVQRFLIEHANITSVVEGE